jgi:outer membrane protein
MTRSITGAAALALMSIACTAQADPRLGWYIQGGPAGVAFNEGATVSAGGSVVPGGGATLSDNATLAVGIGYRFSPEFSVIGILGIPPTTTVDGTGPLTGLTVGKVTYGPAILALNYHIPTGGRLQPFVGAGINFTKVFSTKDGDITSLDAKDAFGPVLRVGFDYMMDDRNGFFFSANKIFVDTTATGFAPALAGAPVEAQISLDPLVLHAGWVHRF